MRGMRTTRQCVSGIPSFHLSLVLVAHFFDSLGNCTVKWLEKFSKCQYKALAEVGSKW